MRYDDWKVMLAAIEGNVATGVRTVPGWPIITNIRADPFENAHMESGMYLRWYADNLWLFVPIQNKLKEFLATISQYPFQEGSSLSADGINYNSLKAAEALKRLQEVESISSPSN